MPKFEKHIFVCGNQRLPGNPRGCCDPAGQAKLQKLFKQKLAERGLKGKAARIKRVDRVLEPATTAESKS
jgi:hypothetical protein